jgi:pimeloyl-ACP methyl ester carboxylesterase
LDKAKVPASFAADVAPDLAAFQADAQLPWGVEALGGQISDAAWKHKPNWYLVTTEDLMIPPDEQRSMAQRIGATTVETAASHSVFVSQPEAVTEIIKAAESGVT